MKRLPTKADILMLKHLKELPCGYMVEKEVRFHNLRKWRFDFVVCDFLQVPQLKLAIEIEGGIWNQGAHVRGKHFESDMEKYNEAIRLGWKILRFSPQQVLTGEAIAFVRKVLEIV